jgi:hypothetical protein
MIKVEKILKARQDLIPSPSRSREHLNFFVFIFFDKTLLGIVNKLFVYKALQCFAFTPQADFPTHNLNFH